MPWMACVVALFGMCVGYSLEPFIHSQFAPEPYQTRLGLKNHQGFVEYHDPVSGTMRLRIKTPVPNIPSLTVTILHDSETQWYRKTLSGSDGIAEKSTVAHIPAIRIPEGTHIGVYVSEPKEGHAVAKHLIVDSDMTL